MFEDNFKDFGLYNYKKKVGFYLLNIFEEVSLWGGKLVYIFN